MAKAMLGDVEITIVYDEKPTETMAVSDHPIETGENVTDHVRQEPFSIVISGMINGPGAAEKLAKLQWYQKNGTLLEYTYRHYLSDMIIQRFERVHDKNVIGGFTFTMTLRNVLISEAATIEDLELPESVQVNKVKSTGKKQTKTKGSTGTTSKKKKKDDSTSLVKVALDDAYALSPK